jgi:hypothetical protein
MTFEDFITVFRYIKKTQGRCFTITRDETGATVWSPVGGEPNISVSEVASLFPEASRYFTLVDVRQERNRLLSACDYTQLPDVDQALRESWAEYRQALRDVTTQPDPTNITWPTAPTTGGA